MVGIKLSQFKNVSILQMLSLAALSVILTWIIAVVRRNELFGYSFNWQVAINQLDSHIFIWGLVVFIFSGLCCFVIVSFVKKLQSTPAVQTILVFCIIFLLGLQYVLG